MEHGGSEFSSTTLYIHFPKKSDVTEKISEIHGALIACWVSLPVVGSNDDEDEHAGA